MRPCRFLLPWRPVVAVVLATAVLFLLIPTAHAFERATIQLKWLHHFQFAGYYMALEKGFYREAGLDVTIKEGGPDAEVEKAVASGQADFGTGTSALLLDLAKGEDFVVLAQIFQHSPAIFLTPRTTGIHSIGDMAGKRFMYANQHGDMRALLKKHGIDEDQIVKVPHNGDPRDLLTGKADVMLAYNFNEPFVLEQAQVPYLTFSPMGFGIDFYGDNIFTTASMLRARPEFVQAFREASLRGWHYALDHKAETVDLIHAKYAPGMSRELLLFEAEQLEILIQPLLVELGYQSLTRWKRINEIFVDLGMISPGFDPTPIIYVPTRQTDYRPVILTLLLAVTIIGVLAWLALTFRRLNVKLKSEIEERRQIEVELCKSQELFSLLMKHTPVYTFIKEIDRDQSRAILVSDNFIDMVGRSAEEMRGRTMGELFPADFARKITDDDLAVVREGKVVELDEELDGRSFTTIKFPIFREGNTTLIAGFTIDTTERKRSEALLRESDERFRLAFENANIGMCLVNPQGKLFKVNRQMSEIFGYSKAELEGMTVNDIAHPDYQAVSTAFINKAESGEIDHSEFEKVYIHKQGRLVWGRVSSSLVRSASGEPLYFISHVLDVTEQKQAEEERLKLERQLLQSQKLESLGVLAGGIAHDFNNILMAIIGNADLALMKLNPESPVINNLHQIEEAAARAADLAKQMLAYSGKGKFVIEKLDLNRLLQEMLHMLEVSISKKAALRLNLAHHLPAIEADATQVRQIIMNLVINASEAIGDESGVIAIATGSMAWDGSSVDDVMLNDNGAAGMYVYLEVSDSGCGMDKEILERIFDPFFSTKFTGRGLGMAAVHGIVRGHKGAIKVQTEPGKGATVTVLLPAAGGPTETLNRAVDRDSWQGSGTVLLVDDEEMVRSIGTELLNSIGYSVVTAGDGIEALATFRSRPDICCVILDLTMPRMDGEQCFRELRQIDPDVKVMISSGYSEHEVVQKFAGTGLAGFIQKPYALSGLKAVMQGVMERSG